ncbi:MAG: hypothetical protein FJZ97_05695 [Chloroflexi bacterium]|nr:hypothetical protein [Chloroflexota bacterium]
MGMEALLEAITGCTGVTGAFVFDSSGRIRARAVPDHLADDQLVYAARVMAQTFLGVERARRRKPARIDLVFGTLRLIVRPLSDAFLGILCTPRINVALLDLTTLPMVRELGQAMERRDAGLPAADTVRADRLKAAVREALGDHADKALEILAAAGTAEADLVGATDEIETMTRLFIDRKKAAEIGRTMRSILEG